MVAPFRGERLIGASTITQQLARNLYLSPKRSLDRKIREAFIARELEASLTKRRILELYLNTIEFGDGVWGITAASRHYFHKTPGSLSPFEGIVLASVLGNPRTPFGESTITSRGRIQRRVLAQLYHSGILDFTQAEIAARGVIKLDTELRNGRQGHEALAIAVSAAHDRVGERSSDLRQPPPALRSILTNECGLGRELREHVSSVAAGSQVSG